MQCSYLSSVVSGCQDAPDDLKGRFLTLVPIPVSGLVPRAAWFEEHDLPLGKKQFLLHLRFRIIVLRPLLVLKGVCHYWQWIYFSRGSSKWSFCLKVRRSDSCKGLTTILSLCGKQKSRLVCEISTREVRNKNPGPRMTGCAWTQGSLTRQRRARLEVKLADPLSRSFIKRFPYFVVASRGKWKQRVISWLPLVESGSSGLPGVSFLTFQKHTFSTFWVTWAICL